MKLTWCRALVPAAAVFAALLPAHAQQQPQASRRSAAQPQAAAKSVLLPARGPASGLRSRRQRCRPAPISFASSRRPPPTSRPRSTASRRWRSAPAARKTASSSCSAASRRSAARSTTRSSRCGTTSSASRPTSSACAAIPRPSASGQRRAILVALAQNNCGAAVPAAGGGTAAAAAAACSNRCSGRSRCSRREAAPAATRPTRVPSGTFRTVCVRTCDGFYYPISAATNAGPLRRGRKGLPRSPARPPRCSSTPIAIRARTSTRRCRSATQQPYTALPNAFRYRTSLDQTCSCRRPGESWSQALKNIEDTTVEQGDIVVNDQRARQLSQPRVDAQGKPIKQAPLAPARARSEGGADRPPAAAPAAATPAAAADCSAAPRSRPSPIPTARCARSGRPSCRRADA